MHIFKKSFNGLLASLTSEHLFDLSTGLGGSELVHNVQSCLAVRVSHSCIDATLLGAGEVIMGNI